MEMDLDSILKIMDRFDKSDMTAFVYETDDVVLRLKSEKTPVVASNVVAAAPVENVAVSTSVDQTEGTTIKSPLVGTFYAAKAEGEQPFISVGDVVKKGQVIGIIEAMKLMNEIEAETDGTVAEILVENEQLVEYGQPLVRLV